MYPIFEATSDWRSDVVMSVGSPRYLRFAGRDSKLVQLSATYDDETFRPCSQPTRENQRTSLVVVGRLVPEKRFDIAINVAADLGLSLDVIGDGPDRARLTAVARRRGGQVTFRGSLPAADIARRLSKPGAVLLVTSKFEGFPVVVLEAAAAGAAVIGLAAPGVSEAVRAVGGSVSASLIELKERILAVRGGNGLRPERIRERFGPSAVADKFWATAIG